MKSYNVNMSYCTIIKSGVLPLAYQIQSLQIQSTEPSQESQQEIKMDVLRFLMQYAMSPLKVIFLQIQNILMSAFIIFPYI